MVVVAGTFTSRRAVGLHVTVVVLVPTFLGLGWWQLHRALSGNWLSWAYTFEWPAFAAYAVYMWWRLLHDAPGVALQPGATGTSGPPSPTTATAPPPAAGPADDGEEAELAAYNRYLAELAEHGRPKRW